MGADLWCFRRVRPRRRCRPRCTFRSPAVAPSPTPTWLCRRRRPVEPSKRPRSRPGLAVMRGNRRWWRQMLGQRRNHDQLFGPGRRGSVAQFTAVVEASASERASRGQWGALSPADAAASYGVPLPSASSPGCVMIRKRHPECVPFDPERRPAKLDLQQGSPAARKTSKGFCPIMTTRHIPSGGGLWG